jgi:glycosyltransferase involved in cell wall biosynthesis
MKLLYFTPSLYNPGGMERVLTEKVNYLVDKLGYDITIVTTEQLGRPCFFLLSDKVKLINLDIDFIKHYNLNYLIKTIAHYKKLRLYKKNVQDILKNINPDICISLCGKEIDFLSRLKNGIPKIAEIHFAMNIRKQFLMARKSGVFWEIVGNIRTAQLKKSIKKLDRLVVLTSQDKKQWPKSFNNITHIPNPNPLKGDQISAVQNKRVITVGKLDAQKGYDLLIEVWSIVAEKHPDWILDIYGQGEYHDLLYNKIKYLNLIDKVNLKGISKNIEIEYLDSSIYVMSSRYEGFGMVLLEAMSCGLPVVSFDCQYGPGELIVDGENGFLIPPNDVKELAGKLCFLIENLEIREKMSIKAKEYSKKYEISKIMKQWDTLFKSIAYKNEKIITN